MQPCPRCGQKVAIWWNGKYMVQPRHKAKGRWCREVRPPVVTPAAKGSVAARPRSAAKGASKL